MNAYDVRRAGRERIAGLPRQLRPEAVGLVSSGAVEAVVVAPPAVAGRVRRRERPPPTADPHLERHELAVRRDAAGPDAPSEVHDVAVGERPAVGPDGRPRP